MTNRAPHARIVEVKRSFDGAREQRFECEVVELTRGRAIVLFRFERDGDALESYGFFWVRRPYNCYYVMRAGSAECAFVRFDVVGDVEIDVRRTTAEVRYRDLLLDLWVDTAGARWEDEADVDRAIDGGALTETDARRIARARATLDRGLSRVIAEARREVSRLAAAL